MVLVPVLPNLNAATSLLNHQKVQETLVQRIAVAVLPTDDALAEQQTKAFDVLYALSVPAGDLATSSLLRNYISKW